MLATPSRMNAICLAVSSGSARRCRLGIRSATATYSRLAAATAKGLAPRIVLYVHALRNAFIPVTSAVGALVPRLLGGTVVTEAVFGWPGMGRLALEAANGRDYPLVVGIAVVVAAIAVASSLAVDVLYARLDPRVRLA